MFLRKSDISAVCEIMKSLILYSYLRKQLLEGKLKVDSRRTDSDDEGNFCFLDL